MINIGLCGAHRVGKSTLAKAYAEVHKLTYVPSRTGEIFKSMGFSVGQKMTADERLTVQEAALDAFVEDIRAVPLSEHWISDRTPLDMAAYVLCELPDAEDLDQERAARYVDRCIRMTNAFVPLVVLIQPGIPYVEEEGKPKQNDLAVERFNRCMLGLIQHHDLNCLHATLHRSRVNLRDRITTLEFITHNVMNALVQSGSAVNQH